jgi:hypothetical protein
MADPRAAATAATAARAKPKTLADVLSADGIGEKKLLITGPGPTEKLQDARIGIGEAHADHVVIKLLGEEQLVIPYSTILTVKIDRTQITIRLR